MARFINHLLSQAALERSLADEALTVYREINLLNEISLKLTSLLEIETLTKAVLDFAKKIKGADNTSILLLDEDNETLTIIAATGQEFSPKTELKAGEGIAGHILMSGKAEIINDVERDSRFIMGNNVIKSMICAPLKLKDRAIGLLNISSETRHMFTAKDLQYLSIIALQTAIAIGNAKYHREVINSLQSLLPICANCKNIRDDKGYWHQVEEYMRDHSDIQFSHTVCNDCIKDLYPELYEEIKSS